MVNTHFLAVQQVGGVCREISIRFRGMLKESNPIKWIPDWLFCSRGWWFQTFGCWYYCFLNCSSISGMCYSSFVIVQFSSCHNGQFLALSVYHYVHAMHLEHGPKLLILSSGDIINLWHKFGASEYIFICIYFLVKIVNHEDIQVFVVFFTMNYVKLFFSYALFISYIIFDVYWWQVSLPNTDRNKLPHLLRWVDYIQVLDFIFLEMSATFNFSF